MVLAQSLLDSVAARTVQFPNDPTVAQTQALLAIAYALCGLVKKGHQAPS